MVFRVGYKKKLINQAALVAGKQASMAACDKKN